LKGLALGFCLAGGRLGTGAMRRPHASIDWLNSVSSIPPTQSVDSIKPVVDSFEPRVQLVKMLATNDINKCLGVHGGGGALMDDFDG
jgi:hypothetical protein